MKKTITFAVILLTTYHLLLLTTVSADSQKGTSTAIFLRMTPGARPASMGNAFVGLADDINALYFNPSGTTQLKEPQFFATYIQWIEGINNSFVGFVYPTGRQAFGLGVNYLSFGDIELRDGAGNLQPTGSVYNSAVIMTFARKIQKSISFGISLKGIFQKYAQYDGNGFAIDLSGLYKKDKLSAGLSLQNIGPQITIDGVGNELPLTIKLGAAYKPQEKLTVGLDLEKPRDNNLKIYTGAEYLIENIFAIRAGYSQIDKFTTTQGWTLGIGSKSILGEKSLWGEEEAAETGSEISIDYAISHFGEELGYTHRISITIKFGKVGG